MPMSDLWRTGGIPDKLCGHHMAGLEGESRKRVNGTVCRRYSLGTGVYNAWSRFDGLRELHQRRYCVTSCTLQRMGRGAWTAIMEETPWQLRGVCCSDLSHCKQRGCVKSI